MTFIGIGVRDVWIRCETGPNKNNFDPRVTRIKTVFARTGSKIMARNPNRVKKSRPDPALI